jgi:hypothetical protein
MNLPSQGRFGAAGESPQLTRRVSTYPAEELGDWLLGSVRRWLEKLAKGIARALPDARHLASGRRVTARGDVTTNFRSVADRERGVR